MASRKNYEWKKSKQSKRNKLKDLKEKKKNRLLDAKEKTSHTKSKTTKYKYSWKEEWDLKIKTDRF